MWKYSYVTSEMEANHGDVPVRSRHMTCDEALKEAENTGRKIYTLRHLHKLCRDPEIGEKLPPITDDGHVYLVCPIKG
jgi:hypothetical protein